LRDRGVRLALLTKREFGCGKPDERVYRDARQETDCLPADTWMVGDTLEWDVVAPMRLGLTGIWLNRLARGLPASAPVQPHHFVTLRVATPGQIA
jgi:putative hydrolase of the HAD superfamily